MVRYESLRAALPSPPTPAPPFPRRETRENSTIQAQAIENGEEVQVISIQSKENVCKGSGPNVKVAGQ